MPCQVYFWTRRAFQRIRNIERTVEGVCLILHCAPSWCCNRKQRLLDLILAAGLETQEAGSSYSRSGQDRALLPVTHAIMLSEKLKCREL